MDQELLREIIEYYTQFAEEHRLTLGSSQLEFERTKELIGRPLPNRAVDIIDVGGAAGAYAFWLSSLGHRVHLIDPTLRLIEEARRHNLVSAHSLASIGVGEAGSLSFDSDSADVVLLLGPLYHLPRRQDRIAALQEAWRLLRREGVLVAAAISRYAGTLDGLALNPALDDQVVNMRHRAVADGQYRNETGNPRYFVTAYFHRPEDLAEELADVGCRDVRVFGIEGPGWLLPDFETRWKTLELRKGILTVARLLEEERSIVGASAHLLGVGMKG